MPRPVHTLAVAVGLAALVGACAGAPRLYHEQITPNYTVSHYNYGAGRRDFLTVVRGDPFNMGEAAFQDAVIEVLNRNQPRPQPTHFTATPGESARTEYRTVLLFDAPSAMISNAICRAGQDVLEGAPNGQTAQNDVVRVAAAFCWGRGALTSITGEVADVASVDDPAFWKAASPMLKGSPRTTVRKSRRPAA
jgi:hypothetical protein